MSLTNLRSSQALTNAVLAGSLAAVMVWFGPPGTDFAAHVFQLHIYLAHGFALWTNYWYAGRYTFVGYSVIYYPLAAVIGIRLLAVLSVAASTAAFTLVLRQTWGEQTVWATRFFAVVAAASVVSAAFPYGLGLAFALCAVVAVARRHVAVFGVLAALTLAASPLAFLFLLLVLGAVAVSRTRQEIVKPALIAGAVGAVGLVIWRLFPDHGSYPFPLSELLAALTFCGLGAALTRRVEKARILHALFVAYAGICLLAYFIPSNLGGNVVRLRDAAIPIAVLALNLRRWRPLPVALIALALAVSWNLSSLMWSFSRTTGDQTASASYWQPVVHYLHYRLSPSYRVEAVATADHWEAVYLPQGGIPIVRGWFRQDDFPQNEVLYDKLTARSYLTWLRRLSVRYVVLTDGSPDYSARYEIALLRSGHSGLQEVAWLPHAVVYRVPAPTPLVTGPGQPRVKKLTESAITLRLSKPGRYQVGIRYTPYLRAKLGCVSEAEDGMTVLNAPRAGTIDLHFSVTAKGALAALTGSRTTCPHAG
jgi:hypothetical protein